MVSPSQNEFLKNPNGLKIPSQPFEIAKGLFDINFLNYFHYTHEETFFKGSINRENYFWEHQGKALPSLNLKNKGSDPPKTKIVENNDGADFLISPEMSSEVNQTDEPEGEKADQKANDEKSRMFRNLNLIDP